MGNQLKEDIVNMMCDGDITMKSALSMHLTSNFYPPLVPKHKQDIVEAFEDYWDYNIDIETLVTRCWMRDIDVLYSKFDTFLNGEDLDG